MDSIWIVINSIGIVIDSIYNVLFVPQASLPQAYHTVFLLILSGCVHDKIWRWFGDGWVGRGEGVEVWARDWGGGGGGGGGGEMYYTLLCMPDLVRLSSDRVCVSAYASKFKRGCSACYIHCTF